LWWIANIAFWPTLYCIPHLNVGYALQIFRGEWRNKALHTWYLLQEFEQKCNKMTEKRTEYDIALLMQVYALQEFDEHCNFTSLSLVLFWQLFYLFCSSIVINTVIVTAETLSRSESGRFGEKTFVVENAMLLAR
jgi:hypothetical protein